MYLFIWSYLSGIFSFQRLSLTQARAHIPCSRQTSLLSMNGNAAHRYYRSTKLPSLSEKSDKTEILSLTVSILNKIFISIPPKDIPYSNFFFIIERNDNSWK